MTCLTPAGLELAKVRDYLRAVLGPQATLLSLERLDDTHADDVTKGFGYGVPLRLIYTTGNGERKCAVLHTMSPGAFGHEDMADRARNLLWSHQAFNRLPRHVRSLDVGGFRGGGGPLVSLGDLEELFLVTEYAEGESYAEDLERLRRTGSLTSLDLARADALCDYLTEIHATPCDQPGRYIRRNRELVGDGECIMGLADSYPEHAVFTPAILEEIEHRAVRWRWRLRPLTHRLRRVHGDFHPWNILFGPDTDFRLLDRSRGEYGDPADDVTALTLNYVFFSLQGSERLEGAFETLFNRFWERYLARTGDREVLQVCAPYFAFRGLVMASPIWYPRLSDTVRHRLLAFILAVLDHATFDPSDVNTYCSA